MGPSIPIMPKLHSCKFQDLTAENIRQFDNKLPNLELLELINCDIKTLPLGLPESCEILIHGCPKLPTKMQNDTYAWQKIEELITKKKIEKAKRLASQASV